MCLDNSTLHMRFNGCFGTRFRALLRMWLGSLLLCSNFSDIGLAMCCVERSRTGALSSIACTSVPEPAPSQPWHAQSRLSQ